MYNGTAEVGSPQSTYALTQPSTSLTGRAVIQNAQYTVNYYFEYSDSKGEFEKITKTGTAQIGSTITPQVTPDDRGLRVASYKSVEYAGSKTHYVYSHANQQSAVVKADGSTTIEYKYYFEYIEPYVTNGQVLFFFYYPSAGAATVPVWLGGTSDGSAIWKSMTKVDETISYDRYWNFKLDDGTITWSKLGNHTYGGVAAAGTKENMKDFHLYVYDSNHNILFSSPFVMWVENGVGQFTDTQTGATWDFDVTGDLVPSTTCGSMSVTQFRESCEKYGGSFECTDAKSNVGICEYLPSSDASKSVANSCSNNLGVYLDGSGGSHGTYESCSASSNGRCISSEDNSWRLYGNYAAYCGNA